MLLEVFLNLVFFSSGVISQCVEVCVLGLEHCLGHSNIQMNAMISSLNTASHLLFGLRNKTLIHMDISVVYFWCCNFVVLVYTGLLSFSKGKYQCFLTKA